jgi:hypothetical protein
MRVPQDRETFLAEGRGKVRTFIIGASLVLALTQVGLAEGKEDLSSANAIMPGCRAFVKGELSSSYIEGYIQETLTPSPARLRTASPLASR